MSAVLRSAVIDIVLPFWLACEGGRPAGRRPPKAAGPGCRPARSREMRRAGKSRRETRRLYTKAAGKPVECGDEQTSAIRPITSHQIKSQSVDSESKVFCVRLN